MKFTAKHLMFILMTVLLVLVVFLGLTVLDRVADFLQVGGGPSVNTPPSSSATSIPSPPGSSVPSSSQVDTPSHEHEFVKGKTFKSTCISSGYTLYVCECGKEDIRDFTDPLGHTYGEYSVIEASCFTDGWTERTCSRCDYVERTELVAAFHVGEWADVPTEGDLPTHEQRICELCSTLEVRSLDTEKDWVFYLTPVGSIGEYVHYEFRVDIANTDKDFTGNIYTNIADVDFRFDYEDKSLFVTYFINGEQKQYTILKGTAFTVFHADGTVTHEEPVAEETPNPDTPPDSEVDPENPPDSEVDPENPSDTNSEQPE